MEYQLRIWNVEYASKIEKRITNMGNIIGKYCGNYGLEIANFRWFKIFKLKCIM